MLVKLWWRQIQSLPAKAYYAYWRQDIIGGLSVDSEVAIVDYGATGR